MNPVMIVRLSIMMFLQFFVWGAWYVAVTGYLSAQNMTGLNGAVYSVGPIAAIIAPFLLGMVADRFFSSQKVLGVLHLLGGALLIVAPLFAAPFELSAPPEESSLFYKVVLHDISAYAQPFTLILLAHMICYMPTLGLTASLSFKNLSNQEKEFPIVRVLGTIGWIIGNIAISFLPGKDQSPSQFYMAGGAALLLGLYSFTLPHTPPPQKGQKPTLGQILGTDSLKLFKSFSYTVFIISSLLICIPLAGYYAQARNFVEATGAVLNDSATMTMSFGQMSEVFMMLLMPLFFVRLGVKWMLAVGMGAWVLRYALFGMAAADDVFWMVFLGVLLHGICYDFFFVTGMIYVDKKAPPDIRNQAQGFLVLVTQGLGLGIGAKLFFAHVLMNTSPEGVIDWAQVWYTPAIFAGVVMILFCLLFHDKKVGKEVEEGGTAKAGVEQAAVGE